MDLRKRVVNAVQHKGYSLRRAAEVFEVGKSSIERWLRRHDDLTPRTSSGRPGLLSEHRAWVTEKLLNNDLTHEARCDALFEHSGVRVSTATMSRWVKRLGNTRKKDAIRQ
jgi:transposase